MGLQIAKDMQCTVNESGDNGTESLEVMNQYLLHHSPIVYVLILKK